MNSALSTKIADLRRDARRVLAVYVLGRLASWMLLAVIVAGLADFFFRFQGPWRVVATSLAAALVIAACGRYLAAFATARHSDLALARRIERRFPDFVDILASAVDFSHQHEDDLLAGSPQLRRAVIIETSTRLEGLDLSTVIERRPARRSIALAGAMAVAAIALVAADPASAQLALRRLTFPLADLNWPQKHHLSFAGAPRRIAVGDTFVADLSDTARRLPPEATVYFSTPAGQEVQRIKRVDGKIAVRREEVASSFFYRAEGGDDNSMPWQQVEVVQPARLVSLSIKLHPPAYTGWPVQASGRHIKALRGTRVEMAGKSDRALVSAQLCRDSAPPIPLVIGRDGRSMSLLANARQPLIVDQSGVYWLKLVDDRQVAGELGRRYQITAVRDETPSVSIEQPDATTTVTPRAVQTVSVLAKDDLRLREIVLRYSRSDRSDIEEFAISIYKAPPLSAKSAPPAAAGQGERRTVAYRWALDALDLKPGTEISFHAAATDYAEQTGKSGLRRFSVVTPEALDAALTERSKAIVAELARALKIQRDVRTQTQSVEMQMSKVGRVETADVDQVQAASFNQGQVLRMLSSSTDGVPRRISRLLADIQANGLNDIELERRMRIVLAELDRLERDHLFAIGHHLTSAIKQTEGPNEPAAAVHPPTATADRFAQKLSAAGQHQEQVIAGLEKIVDSFSEWDSQITFARQLAELEKSQHQLLIDSRELARLTVAKDLNDLAPQERAAIEKAAGRQSAMTGQLDRLERQMAGAAKRLEKHDPRAAATLASAVDFARREATAGKMRESAGALAANRLGQAALEQERILADFEQLSRILSGRRREQASQLVKEFKELEQKLAGLHDRQAKAESEIGDSKNIEDKSEQRRQLKRLARIQQDLEKSTRDLARQLKRLEARAASKSAERGSGNMAQAGNAADEGNQSTAENSAHRALQDLQQARNELARDRREAERTLARQQVAKLEDLLKDLEKRQRQLAVETERLEQLRTSQGKLTRAQTLSLRELAGSQRNLNSETGSAAEQLAGSEVFQFVLDEVQQHMDHAAGMLERRDTGPRTQGMQQNAANRLAQLTGAMRSGSPNEPLPGQSGEAAGEGEGSRQYLLAELKLLKALQQELNERALKLTQSSLESTAAEQTQAYAELARQQGRLAQIALKLSDETAGSEDEDTLPADDDAGKDAHEKDADDESEIDRVISPDAAPDGADSAPAGGARRQDFDPVQLESKPAQ